MEEEERVKKKKNGDKHKGGQKLAPPLPPFCHTRVAESAEVWLSWLSQLTKKKKKKKEEEAFQRF